MQSIKDIEMVVLDNTKKDLLTRNEEDDKLESALRRAKGFFQNEEEELELDEEEEEIEVTLAKHFFELPSSIKEQLQEKIPLKILKRLKRVHEENLEEQRSSSQGSGKSQLDLKVPKLHEMQ